MTEKHAVTRQRFDTRRRTLTVKAAERLTPNMVRVTLGGDLEGFTSLGFDDHIKLIFAGPDGEAPMRDYTPRRYDADSLTIDFALHDTGPATDWAVQAAPGQTLEIGGPRGSFVVPDDFDWHLLIADETALPAIGRRLEELRPGVKAIVLAAVSGPAEEQTFDSAADLDIHWVHRPLNRAADPAPILAALSAIALPQGDGYVFAAGESSMAKAVRQQLVGERGHNKAWIKAAGYWRPDAANVHDKHEDDDA